MALLPVFYQHGYSITLFNGIEAVFDDLPSILDTNLQITYLQFTIRYVKCLGGNIVS